MDENTDEPYPATMAGTAIDPVEVEASPKTAMPFRFLDLPTEIRL
jgi:hypothetical protein